MTRSLTAAGIAIIGPLLGQMVAPDATLPFVEMIFTKFGPSGVSVFLVWWLTKSNDKKMDATNTRLERMERAIEKQNMLRALDLVQSGSPVVRQEAQNILNGMKETQHPFETV